MSAHKKTASFKGFAHHWLALSLSVDDKWHWKWQHGVREEAERGRLWGNQCNRKFWLNVCSYLQENSETMPLFEGLICLRLTYRRNMYYRTKTRLLTMIYSRSWAPLFRLLLFFLSQNGDAGSRPVSVHTVHHMHKDTLAGSHADPKRQTSA